MTSAPPTKVAAAATKGAVVVSPERQRTKLSRDAKKTVHPSAAARPIIRQAWGRTRSPASATPPSTISTEPTTSAEAHARATAITSGEPIRRARMERVWIVGGGSIGSLLAAHLSRVTETWVLCRRSGHAEALEAHGLRVSGRADFLGRPRATADPAELPPAELAIVATKATDVEAAAAGLATLPPAAVVMT